MTPVAECSLTVHQGVIGLSLLNQYRVLRDGRWEMIDLAGRVVYDRSDTENVSSAARKPSSTVPRYSILYKT